MDYRPHYTEHRRLSLLKSLARAPGFKANDAILQIEVARFGIDASRDQIKTDLTWLNEQGLATVAAEDHLLIATLTQRGGDVASGLATVPGVARPSPRP